MRNNRAGLKTFVSVDQVLGTLDRAFEIYRGLPPGFARAAIMMFAVAEVHPFTDGNGRIARIVANAELSAANECRLLIPTGYRENYLSALGALTHNQNPRPVVRMLAWAQRFTAAVPWETVESATRWLEAAGAFDGRRDAPPMRIPDPWDI